MRIAYLVNLFKPAALIVGGGLETAGSMIMGPIEKTVRRFARSGDFASVKIFPGSIGEGAVSIGALSLAVREVFLNA
jgi:glucokinase